YSNNSISQAIILNSALTAHTHTHTHTHTHMYAQTEIVNEIAGMLQMYLCITSHDQATLFPHIPPVSLSFCLTLSLTAAHTHTHTHTHHTHSHTHKHSPRRY